MREIKFRAWDIEDKIMKYSEKMGWSYWGDCIMESIIEYNDNSIILMQYTGLKDKNGKEIYEGDVLKTDAGELIEVKHLNEFYDEVTMYECGFLTGEHACEIIGNKFKNPELLDDEK